MAQQRQLGHGKSRTRDDQWHRHGDESALKSEIIWSQQTKKGGSISSNVTVRLLPKGLLNPAIHDGKDSHGGSSEV